MAEQYFLAVDLGTSRVGAATARVAADGSIVTAAFPLGRRGDSVAAVVFVGEDGDLLFGDAAERRGVTQPERLIREFKRSIGDEVPLIVGGRVIPAEELYARTVADIIDTVREREAAAPTGVILTHPAMWGAHRVGLISSALAALGIRDVQFMTEPEAAARHYEASRVLEPGETIAVYDLGGGTFDCVVLRKTESSFELVGEPVGLDNLGGADFDDAVVRHVLRSAEVSGDALDDSSPDARVALSQLRRECVDAKEALSFDSDVVIPVLLPAGRSSVRLTRPEFEDMIDPFVAQTIDALEEALDAVDVDAEQLESVLLIGGSSRIPLITQRLSERLDRPTAIDADPKASIALGAAQTGLILAMDREISAGELVVVETASAGELGLAAENTPPIAAPVSPVVASPAPGIRHTIAVSAAAVLVAAAIVFGSTVTLGNGNGSFLSLSGWEPTPTPAETEPAAPVDPVADAPPSEQEAAPPPNSGSNGTNTPRSVQNSRGGAPISKAAPQRRTTTSTTTTTKEGTTTQPGTKPSTGTTGQTPAGGTTPTPGGGSTPAPGGATPAPVDTTGGETGGDTGGSTGGDTGGSTGGDTGGSTGGDTGGTGGETPTEIAPPADPAPSPTPTADVPA